MQQVDLLLFFDVEDEEGNLVDEDNENYEDFEQAAREKCIEKMQNALNELGFMASVQEN